MAGSWSLKPVRRALGFQEIRRSASERPAAGVDVLSQLARTAASPDDRLSTKE
jgi:hypothetical protein